MWTNGPYCGSFLVFRVLVWLENHIGKVICAASFILTQHLQLITACFSSPWIHHNQYLISDCTRGGTSHSQVITQRSTWNYNLCYGGTWNPACQVSASLSWFSILSSNFTTNSFILASVLKEKSCFSRLPFFITVIFPCWLLHQSYWHIRSQVGVDNPPKPSASAAEDRGWNLRTPLPLDAYWGRSSVAVWPAHGWEGLHRRHIHHDGSLFCPRGTQEKWFL